MFDGSGWWVIFPIIGLIFMVVMMSFMMFRMFGSWRRVPGSEREAMRMGPMA